MQDETMVNDILEIYKDDLEKSLTFLKNEYMSVRAGRANPHILDKVFVDYYGQPTPLNQMANISVPEARMLLISVWDQTQLKNVSKAITMADLGVMPSDDGKVIRLIFPALTEDRRRDIVKQLKKLAEEAKVTMRNARRDCLDEFKSLKKEGQLSEDEMAGLEKDVQKILDGYASRIDDLCNAKEKEVLEI